MRWHHILYDITCSVSWHPSHYIWHYLHSICVTKTSASIIPHQLSVWHYTLYVWHHSQYAWHHMKTLWHHTRIGMTSHTIYLWYLNNIDDIDATAFMKTQLYLTSHPLHLTSQPLYLCCNTHCIDQSQQFWKSSHLAHILHHTHSTWHHNHTLWHHSTIFMTSQPLHSWHQIPYIWHHLHCLWHLVPYHCDITNTIFLNTYQLYLTTNIRCRDNTTTISEITTSICVSLWSHTLYRWCNIHCIYDMAPTIFKAQYALYMTSHPRFMTSQHSIHYISLLYLISNWLYLIALPLYLYHHTLINNHITPLYLW